MADLASRITKPDGQPADAQTDAAPAAPAEPSTVADAQNDGTAQDLGGPGLHEPDYEVEVSLSDLQDNEATPFHSATSWQDLGL